MPTSADHSCITSCFFLFDYSGLRQSSLSILNANVPTVAEKQGDFSADSFIIYDPSTYNPTTKTIQPFPGNKIPHISDFAKKFSRVFSGPHRQSERRL